MSNAYEVITLVNVTNKIKPSGIDELLFLVLLFTFVLKRKIMECRTTFPCEESESAAKI